MDFSLIGIGLVIFIGLVALIRPFSVVYLCAFLTPFSGILIINIPAVEFGIIPFTFSAVIWLILYLIKIGSPNPRSANVVRGQGLLNISMVLFIIVTAISLIMPVVIDGQDQYTGAGILGPQSTYSIKFSAWHLIHFAALVIGVSFAISAANVIRYHSRIESTIRWYVAGGVFAAAVGLTEVALSYRGYLFPINFFNVVSMSNIAELGASRFDGKLGLPRISSVAQEPSIFGLHLSVVMALLFTQIASAKTIFSKRVDIIFVIVIFMALIYSLSTTAYAGIAIVLSLTMLLSMLSAHNTLRVMIYICTFVAVVAIVVMLTPDAGDVIDYFIIEKLQSGSFQERILTVKNAFFLGMDYPVLGVGWGVVPSFDLFVKIFIGSGVLGVIVFLSILYAVFRALWKTRSESLVFVRASSARIQADSLLVALTTLIIIYAMAGFEYRYGDFWILLALSSATIQRWNTENR